MAAHPKKNVTTWTHEQLKHRAYTILCDRFKLGWVYPEVMTPGGIFDVVGKRPHHRHIIGIECKASRADFLSDMRSGKWKNYLPYCNELWFYVNRGVCKKEEIPENIGLMYATNSNHVLWRSQTKPKHHQINHLKYAAVVESLFSISIYRKFTSEYWDKRDDKKEITYWKGRHGEADGEVAMLRALMAKAGVSFDIPQVVVNSKVGGRHNRWWECPSCNKHINVWGRSSAKKGSIVRCGECSTYAQVEKEQRIKAEE